jgi:hypothetical protein
MQAMLEDVIGFRKKWSIHSYFFPHSFIPIPRRTTLTTKASKEIAVDDLQDQTFYPIPFTLRAKSKQAKLV